MKEISEIVITTDDSDFFSFSGNPDGTGYIKIRNFGKCRKADIHLSKNAVLELLRKVNSLEVVK